MTSDQEIRLVWDNPKFKDHHSGPGARLALVAFALASIAAPVTVTSARGNPPGFRDMPAVVEKKRTFKPDNTPVFP